MKILTGIGSRETPREILEVMRKVCKKMVLQGYTLRSGGADGADAYCAYGWGDAWSEDAEVPDAEIYIPWSGFNNLKVGQKNVVLVQDTRIIQSAHKLLKQVHPAFDKLTRGPLALHTRNCFQVLGADLCTKSSIVLAYAKTDSKGNPMGGTATAINIAKREGITVRNLYLEADLEKAIKYLEKEQ